MTLSLWSSRLIRTTDTHVVDKAKPMKAAASVVLRVCSARAASLAASMGVQAQASRTRSPGY